MPKAEPSTASATFCMTAMRSSVLDSDLPCATAAWNHYGFRQVLPTSMPSRNDGCARYRKNVFPGSFCLGRVRYGVLSMSTLRIFMPSVRIRGRETSCCPSSRLSEVAGPIALNAGHVSEVCSGIMPVPHE